MHIIRQPICSHHEPRLQIKPEQRAPCGTKRSTSSSPQCSLTSLNCSQFSLLPSFFFSSFPSLSALFTFCLGDALPRDGGPAGGCLCLTGGVREACLDDPLKWDNTNSKEGPITTRLNQNTEFTPHCKGGFSRDGTGCGLEGMHS